MPTAPGLIFTIEIDGKPTVAFEAKQLREAFELCSEKWFVDDLSAMSSNGVPLCKADAKLEARTANEAEIALYLEGASAAARSDDLVLVYLIDLDSTGTADDQPVDPGAFPPKQALIC